MTDASPAKARELLAHACDAFLVDRDPRRLLRARTELVDRAVREAAECLSGRAVPRLAVVAVGGYGRRELFPHSDVDILLLAGAEGDPGELKEPVSEFLRILWDSGIRVSHSVRTAAECCEVQEENIEFGISLLDVRFLSGAYELFEVLAARLPEISRRETKAILGGLSGRVRQRHAKFNNTVYHLEPNIKEAPGGIRDIHLVRWLAQLLPQHAAISESLRELEPAERFLYGLRCFLHVQAGRDNNLLSFERQDEAARALPFTPMAPEAWMRLYFQHARRVFDSSLRALEYAETQNPSLVGQFREWRSRLSTREFTISRERVFLRNPAETLLSAESILGLFTFAGRHGIRLSWDTERRLRADVDKISGLFRETPPAWRAWRELFAASHAALALDQMQETGLLAAAIPEWQTIDSLVVRDFYHRYTVDEHTLVAVETIDDLIAKKPATPARFHEFAIEEDDHVIVRLALLLHDLGKGETAGEHAGRDHVKRSMALARSVIERMKAPEHIAEAISFLVEHHLDLSTIMNGRDLEDPATARLLTRRVATREDLRRLALITYADISAVNPTAMTPWRLEQLWRVYSLGEEQLTRELATERIHESSLARGRSALPGELAKFIEGFPQRYLRTHTRDQIEHHAALAAKSGREDVAIEISRESGAYVMTVSARDQPGLFASLCGTLAGFGMNIVKAEAAANSASLVLDLIRFTDPMRTLELNPEEVSRLQWTAECVVKGTLRVSDLLKRRGQLRRAAAHAMAPSARFDNHASDNSTLIEFSGEDRPGLLYDLAAAISSRGCNIEIVMVDTEAHRAFDVFYVTQNGAKLSEAMAKRLQRDLVGAAGGAPDSP